MSATPERPFLWTSRTSAAPSVPAPLALARVVDRRPWWRRILTSLAVAWGHAAARHFAARRTCATCGLDLSEGAVCWPCGQVEAQRLFEEAPAR